jgi:signal transduction histidine kinase
MVPVDTLRGIFLFESLTDEQLEDLAAAAEIVPFVEGDILYEQGDPATQWWILLDGEVDVMRWAGGAEPLVMVTMERPGVWAGGFRAWSSEASYLTTGRGSVAGHMLRVPADALGAYARKWFPFCVHLLEGFFQTVRNVEAQSRERESLIALGRLAAGMAHEINNPASAAVRAVDELQETATDLLSSLGRLAEHSTRPGQFIALEALRQELPGTAPTDPVRLASQEEEILAWLEQRGVESAWRIAPPLAAAGADVAWCDRAAGVLEDVTLEPGFAWAAGTVSTLSLLGEVKEATSRVSSLVEAVKSYSQLDRATTQEVDVTDGIESTLVMLRHKIGAGITVERDYQTDAPPIPANPGELNQVWTNLIDNALDAMGDDGTLRISTRAEPGVVVVEVADTGPGMPPEVQARAFQPFFTTKEVGQGTGLGLDISRRIVVDGHHGDITIDTGPQGTTMRVALPR